MLMAMGGRTRVTRSPLMAHSGKIEMGTIMETILTETMLMHSLMILASGLIRMETDTETGQLFQMGTSSLVTRLNGVISMAMGSETTLMATMEISAQNFTENLQYLLQEDVLILTMMEL